jgi:PAB-dependent poly(A)-specific ribonuclease subunit 3
MWLHYTVDVRLAHPQAALGAIDMWRKVKHPAIVPIHEAFTTRSFNDSCECLNILYEHIQTKYILLALVVVYSYFAGAQTMQDLHFKGNFVNAAPEPIPERTLWSYIVQIAGAIRRIHEAGLAVRTLEPSKIIVTGKSRYVFPIHLFFDTV